MGDLEKKKKFLLMASVVLIFSIVVGYFISVEFGYNLLTVVSTISTIGILLGTLYSVFMANQKDDNPKQNSKQDTNSEKTESSTNDTESQQIGPSSGLRPKQKQAQNKLIQVAYKKFEENPFLFMLTYQGTELIQETAEQLDMDQDEVSKVWQFSKDDGFFRKRGNAWRMTPKSLFRVKELGQEIQLEDSIQEEILDSLFQEYRSSPNHAPVSQNTLLNSISQTRETILQNLWYLCEKNYIERNGYMGNKADYEITRLGRQVMDK